MYQQGNYEGAIKHFKASADERSYCRDYELLGNAYFANGNYREAAQLNPDDIDYWKDLSLVYFRMGSYDDALKAIENALISGVGIEIKMEDYAEAIRNMKIYLQAAPDAPNVRVAKDEIIKWELMLEKKGAKS